MNEVKEKGHTIGKHSHVQLITKDISRTRPQNNVYFSRCFFLLPLTHFFNSIIMIHLRTKHIITQSAMVAVSAQSICLDSSDFILKIHFQRILLDWFFIGAHCPLNPLGSLYGTNVQKSGKELKTANYPNTINNCFAFLLSFGLNIF